jgi:ATP-binding cassette subfamily F protein 3
MIRIQNLSLTLGGKVLFSNLSWAVPAGSRWGLIGANGTGKTTLMKILTGAIAPDSGTVEMPSHATIGYLPQDFIKLNNLTIMAFLRKRQGIDDVEKHLLYLEERIASGDDDKSTLLAYERQRERFETMKGYSFEAEAGKILAGLGFSPADAGRSCLEFSGGWKMRIYLAALLLERPDILLLDEPTNHLDLESVNWVERHLTSFPGTVIVISHDRHFLDSVTEKTAELTVGKIETYKGGYTEYLEEKNRREEISRKTIKKLERRREEIMSFAERFRYKASKASQVQSRLKQLDKDQPVEALTKEKRASIKFPPCPRSGLEVFKCENLGKSYGEKKVLEGVSLNIRRGEKLALVGVNGAGKSTLARIMAGVEPPCAGMVHYGHNVKKAFFSQESQANLGMGNTVWQEVLSVTSQVSDAERRNLLGAFLFEGDEIEKPVSVLSGGEMSRLSLLKLLLTDANFLILDEPTNHLDIATREILLHALQGWDGTAVIVSHDRWFLDGIVNKVIEIRRGKCRVFPGNVSYYLEKREEEETGDLGQQETAVGTHPREVSLKDRKRIEAAKRNERYRIRKTVLDELEPLEREISKSERRRDEIDELLCNPEVLEDSDRIRELMMERDEIEKYLEASLEEWEAMMERLEEIDKAFAENL